MISPARIRKLKLLQFNIAIKAENSLKKEPSSRVTGLKTGFRDHWGRIKDSLNMLHVWNL